jgi:hypothetical protein
MNHGHRNGDRRMRAHAAALSLVVLATPASVAAQVTILVPEAAVAARDVDAGIAQGMREGLGASVRRVDPSLEDLALAAGCEGDPSEPSCIAEIAHASGARLVALERVWRGPHGYRVEIELRRASDGSAIRSFRVECGSSRECGRAVLAVLESEPEADAPDATVQPVALGPSHRAPIAEPLALAIDVAPPAPPPPVEAPSRDRGPRSRHEIPVAPNVVFALSVATSLGAMIAGGVGVGMLMARDSVVTLGTELPEQTARISALDANRDLALGLGTAFALAGACLAVSGAIAMALLPHAPSDARAGIVLDGSSLTLALDGTF